MEEHIVTISVITDGEKCEMSDSEIIDWYTTQTVMLNRIEHE